MSKREEQRIKMACETASTLRKAFYEYSKAARNGRNVEKAWEKAKENWYADQLKACELANGNYHKETLDYIKLVYVMM